MARKIKALVFTAPYEMETREFDLPECGPDDVVVKTHYSMVSTGTDSRVLAGKQDIRGDEPYYPVVPGYSIVGEIVEVGSAAKGWRVGDLVSGRNPAKPVEGIRTTWGGHASYQVYPSTGYCQPILLPSGAEPLDYIAVELAAISHRGAVAAAALPGETAVVIGQGIIGATSAAWLAAAGARVVVADMASNRLKRAAQWGVSAAFSAREPDIVERIQAFTAGGADIVVESSGSMAGIRMAGQLTKDRRISIDGGAIRWPRFVFQATYTEEYSVNPPKLFVGDGAIVLCPGDRTPEDRSAAVEAFRTGVFNPKAFVDHVLPISEAQSAYEGLRLRPDDYFTVAFDWRT
ncbi:MAG TPA: zinc-binding dehydrogenase [Capsulimonadaceae bacterium]|jgi:2-desacetyl-2-hydroxyethyl bacteriochlorophyllide A dehydrogenase